MVKSTIRIKVLTKRGQTSSSLRWGQEQGLQWALRGSIHLIPLNFNPNQIHSLLKPLIGPMQTETFSQPHSGSLPQAPSTRAPALFSSKTANPRAPTLSTERRETWRLPGKTLSKWREPWTSQVLIPFPPRQPGAESCLTNTSLLAAKDQVRMMFSHSSLSSHRKLRELPSDL